MTTARSVSVRILVGDCRARLAELPDESVHAVVTSPPFFGLRSYLPDGHRDKALEIGLEQTPDEYVAALVDVFRDVRRVLRDDGTLWLNLGDSYAASRSYQVADNKNRRVGPTRNLSRAVPPPGLKEKDLIGIPWMVAFALRSDGWWLRGDHIWAKANGMPDSTEDRPGRAHEYVFLLSKSARYHYDAEAVRLPPMPESVERLGRAMRAKADAGSFVMSGGGYAPPGQPPHQGARRADKQAGHAEGVGGNRQRRYASMNARYDSAHPGTQRLQGCGLRSVWWLAPANFPDAHYAVMPDELAAVCILAGCPEGGTVLDPFGGAGTTGLVASGLNRSAILIELSPENAELARKRIGLFASVEPAPIARAAE